MAVFMSDHERNILHTMCEQDTILKLKTGLILGNPSTQSDLQQTGMCLPNIAENVAFVQVFLHVRFGIIRAVSY